MSNVSVRFLKKILIWWSIFGLLILCFVLFFILRIMMEEKEIF